MKDEITKNYIIEASGDRVLDMAHEDWDRLPHEEQVTYAKHYQMIYAKYIFGLTRQERLRQAGVLSGNFWLTN